MSIFTAIKQFLNGQPARVAEVASPALFVPEPAPADVLHVAWEHTTGRLQRPSQDVSVTYRNGLITGTCTGRIGQISGSVMVGLFEDIPTWLPDLLIRLTVRTDEGKLTVSLREPNGTIVSLVAPGTFDCMTELVNGRAWLRCESGPTPVRNLSYEAVII